MTEAIEFDETGTYVCVVCNTGGDTYLRVYQIDRTGGFIEICKHMPSDWGTNVVPRYGYDPTVAVNGERKLIGVLMTRTSGGEHYPIALRMTCGVCDLQSGKRFWIRSFDSEVTGDARSFLESRHPSHLHGDLLFLNPDELVCNVSYNSLVMLDAFTGEETRRLPLGHNHGVRSFALDRQRKRLWTVSARSELYVYDV